MSDNQGRMFSYHLPESDYNDNSYINSEGNIKFEPPVYEQRYGIALRILDDYRWKKEIKSVVDFGCAEMRFMTLLRRMDHIEKIVGVDVDEDILQLHKQRLKPLMSDYLNKRKNPLRVEIFQGSIGASVNQLCGIDAVVALELIEHLESNILDNVPSNVFGFMRPKLAIISTPNADFNVLFQGLVGFRHPDHKFEWTREEFRAWAFEICTRYPNYSVTFLGVGKPPPNKKKLGHCSQVALFVRNDVLLRNDFLDPNDLLDRSLCDSLETDTVADSNPHNQYKLIYADDFPFQCDERTKQEKILDEAEYMMGRMRGIDLYFNRDRCIYKMPLKPLVNFAASLGVSEEELHGILRTKADKIKLEGDSIVLPEFDESSESDLDDDYCVNTANATSPDNELLVSPEECWD